MSKWTIQLLIYRLSSVIMEFQLLLVLPQKLGFKKDKDRFLSADLWPENVIVRDWFFKGKHTNSDG